MTRAASMAAIRNRRPCPWRRRKTLRRTESVWPTVPALLRHLRLLRFLLLTESGLRHGLHPKKRPPVNSNRRRLRHRPWPSNVVGNSLKRTNWSSFPAHRGRRHRRPRRHLRHPHRLNIRCLAPTFCTVSNTLPFYGKVCPTVKLINWNMNVIVFSFKFEIKEKKKRAKPDELVFLAALIARPFGNEIFTKINK